MNFLKQILNFIGIFSETNRTKNDLINYVNLTNNHFNQTVKDDVLFCTRPYTIDIQRIFSTAYVKPFFLMQNNFLLKYLNRFYKGHNQIKPKMQSL
jgi:hypothetical protein